MELPTGTPDMFYQTCGVSTTSCTSNDFSVSGMGLRLFVNIPHKIHDRYNDTTVSLHSSEVDNPRSTSNVPMRNIAAIEFAPT